MSGVVYEAPKGVFTRLVSGYACELYDEWKKSGRAVDKKKLDTHMEELHNAWLKLEGRK